MGRGEQLYHGVSRPASTHTIHESTAAGSAPGMRGHCLTSASCIPFPQSQKGTGSRQRDPAQALRQCGGGLWKGTFQDRAGGRGGNRSLGSGRALPFSPECFGLQGDQEDSEQCLVPRRCSMKILKLLFWLFLASVPGSTTCPTAKGWGLTPRPTWDTWPWAC